MHKQLIQYIPPQLTVGTHKQVFYFLDTIPEAEIILKKNSNTTIVALISDGWDQERHLTIRAAEPGAQCRLLILILGNAQEKFTATITAVHGAPKTDIKARIRTALTGSATCAIAGDWIIEKKAIGADTHFAHHTLLLSDTSAAKSSPNLEIKTDNVKAGHSASVGKIDEDMLFYLLSRGISEKNARTLIVHGFFEHELASITDETVKQYASEKVHAFLS